MENAREQSFSSANDAPPGKIFMIGISGGSASGKTSIANRLIQSINLPNVILISMDSFYSVLTPEENKLADNGQYNFDSLEAFDLPLLEDCLFKLKLGLPVDIPEYDFCTHSRTANSTRVTNSSVVVFEGIMTLSPPSILPLLDLKVFVDTDDDVRLARRFIRDIAQRGRTQCSVLEMYFKFSKSGYDNYIAPSARNADLIIPRGGDNEVAINLLIKHIKHQLRQRGIISDNLLANSSGRSKCVDGDEASANNVVMLEPTPYICALLAAAKVTGASQFHLIEAHKNLACMLIDRALAVGACNSLETNSANGLKAHILGVSLTPIFEDILKQKLPSAFLTKINVQPTGQVELHPTCIPFKFSDSLTLILDYSVSSGTSAKGVINALVQRDLNPENAIFVCFFSSSAGLTALQQAFPNMRVVCAEIVENTSTIPIVAEHCHEQVEN